jgi:2',3'-cyclic-nucleotide 2'-phosphodiesterase (5'-nucleotidase family)
MLMPKLSVILCCFVFLHLSNKVQSQKTEVIYQTYTINSQEKNDTAITRLLKPYTDNLQKHLQTIIGFSTRALYKKMPESSLGNFLADGIKSIAEKLFEQKIDIACINYGSIKHFIPKGDIVMNDIYQLFPYDSYLVLQQIDGYNLQLFLNKIVEQGGWPISGIKLSIKDKQAVDILINNEPLNINTTYTLACNDYIAKGGNGCFMLKQLPSINKGFLLRDVLIDYIKQQTKLGNPIEAKTDKRITNTL